MNHAFPGESIAAGIASDKSLVFTVDLVHIYPTQPCIIGNRYGLTVIFARKINLSLVL